jgi:asparagine synthase (glutamine-hydrolysing)
LSGFGAIYNLNRQPLALEKLVSFASGVDHRGPDASGHWLSGPVGLAHRALHTTPESLEERQPFVNSEGFAIVLDGRVDNAPDLLQSLLNHSGAVRGDGDAELVLSLYLCFGVACVSRIIGDFSFAIWDPRRRELFCARDALGIRPFFYHASHQLFIAGSEVGQILRHEAVSSTPNEGMIAEYLACAMNELSETLYRDVRRLPPAHFIVAGVDGIQVRRYFDINAGKTIRYTNDQEYAEHFGALFKEAVRCRLRSPHSVGIFLSGGVDSSSVAAVASHLMKNTVNPVTRLEALSLVFPGQSDCDESEYIRDAVLSSALPARRSTPTIRSTAQYLADVLQFRDFPDYPNGAMSNSLSELARQSGIRVVLTGLGGDEWLMGSYCHYADLLKSFRFAKLRRQLVQDAISSGGRVSWRKLFRFGVWPLLPTGVQSAMGRLLSSRQVPPWIDASFARRTDLADRLSTQSRSPDFPAFAQKDLYQVFASGWRVHALEMEDRSAANQQIEQRHPFSDRRILEFALALPEEQRWKDQQTKYILRNAMKPFLPESIRSRRTKAEFSSVFTRTFEINGGKYLFQDLPIGATGWIRQDVIDRKYLEMEAERQAGEPAYTRHACPLWMVFGINLWFEALCNRSDRLINCV